MVIVRHAGHHFVLGEFAIRSWGLTRHGHRLFLLVVRAFHEQRPGAHRVHPYRHVLLLLWIITIHAATLEFLAVEFAAEIARQPQAAAFHLIRRCRR